MNGMRTATITSDGYLLLRASSNEIRWLVQGGWLSFGDVARGLAEEGAAGLITYKDACVHIKHSSLLLESCGFLLSHRRGAYFLKDALFAFDSD